MKIEYPAIVFALFSGLIVLVFSWTHVNIAMSKTKNGATPTPAKSPQKTGCTMPTPTPSTETPTPTPIPTATPVVRKGRFHHDRRTANVIEAVAKQMDWDCDGISNYDDNCLGIYNPDQVDKDKNGFGDACEQEKIPKTVTSSPTQIPQKEGCMMPPPTPTGAPTASPSPTREPIIGTNVVREREMSAVFAAMRKYDRDCDGVNDLEDNCKEVYNPTQRDKNKNGFGDACEPRNRRANLKPKNRN